jgi:hypothetical protein
MTELAPKLKCQRATVFDWSEQNPYSEHPIVAQPQLTDYAEVSGPCDFNSLRTILPFYQLRNVDTIRGMGALGRDWRLAARVPTIETSLGSHFPRLSVTGNDRFVLRICHKGVAGGTQ